MPVFDVNPWAVLLAAIINVVIGALWYSPKVFGEVWAQSHGFDTKSLRPTPFNYAGGILVALVTAYGLAVFVRSMPISNIGEALMFAFFAWVTFIVTSHFSGVIWAKKPLQAYVIDTLCLLVAYILMTLVLFLWK